MSRCSARSSIRRPFAGTAKVRLVGLPNKVMTPDVEITKDTKELAFKVTVDKTSPPGQHRNIFCQVVVTENGEPILHNVGGTELRIDVPLPPKVAVAPKPPTPTAKPVPAPVAKPVEKRLTRLEKLRLEQEEREKAAKATGVRRSDSRGQPVGARSVSEAHALAYAAGSDKTSFVEALCDCIFRFFAGLRGVVSLAP